jgi:glycosyltransferase involved in cell wall biosynthesis
MKILWVKNDFLHPTNRGGQIRTLEILRHLHRTNEVHYVGYADPDSSEGEDHAAEYSTRAYPVRKAMPHRRSPKFFLQLAANLLSPLPLAVDRFVSREMRTQIAVLLREHTFDAIVCDYLICAPNFPDMSRVVLFQHNVETRIWQRHAQHAPNALLRAYFRLQARRMFDCERKYSRLAAHVISVSASDSADMRTMFGVKRISEIPTGVDIDFFTRPANCDTKQNTDLVFLGAMDWLPNVDGARWFMAEVLPRIRASRPQASVTFAGRNPVPEISQYAKRELGIRVTGTVPDVRPWLWQSAVSIVPLRIGGGTRLKIYEAMAAGVPVVSTTVGAEGLAVNHSRDIILADDPADFARACVSLLESEQYRRELSNAARSLVTARFSSERVGGEFETILIHACHPAARY